jgi:hypothetical protein
MSLAPIVLFVYNRPDHTRKTLESLQNNILASESELFIFSDGSKNDAAIETVNKVREYIKSIQGFKNITIIERQENLGLANSVISGITEIINKYGKVIVLEDDMILSKYFLKYMNDTLDIYENKDEVISIHAFAQPLEGGIPDTYFLRCTGCWGWATWKRGWNLFESDGQKLLNEIKEKKLKKVFDINGSYPFTQMLEDQVKGLNNSWAIRWHASALLNDKLTLHPGKSQVKNIGFDGAGVHCGISDDFNVNIEDIPVIIKEIPLKENLYVRTKFQNYLKSVQQKKTNVFATKIKFFIDAILSKIT